MHLPTLTEISPLLLQYGYLMYFILSVFEGPIVTIIAGSLVALGYFNFFIMWTMAVLGDLVGDFLYYVVGRWGGKWLIGRKRFLGVDLEQLKKMDTHFADHGGKTLLFGKLTHAVGAPILFAAGAAKMPLGRFTWFNLLGTIPKALAFLIVGYYFGQAYQQIDHYYGYAVLAILIGVAILIGGYFFVRRMRARAHIE